MTSQHPVVTLVPPPDDLPTDHHGPPPAKVALGAVKPKYFQNPWRSWRNPSLTDAWTAYQKGAAIALPLPEIAKPSSIADSSDLTDDPEEPDTVSRVTSRGGHSRAEDGSMRKDNSGYILPGKIYVRPEFSTFHDDDEENFWRDPPLDVVAPTWDGDREGKSEVTWLGHASVMVRIPWRETEGVRRGGMCGVLFDPIFSYRCSPSQYVGPARYLNPPCTVAELPAVHIVCISHDHYDHLDYNTILELWKWHQQTIHFIVPLGLAAWFKSCGIPPERVTELDWWHEVILDFPSPTAPGHNSSYANSERNEEDLALRLKLVFTPAQHRSGRGVFDHMTTLWGSWCLGEVRSGTGQERGMKDWDGFKLFFGGDTGYRYATAPEDDPEAICPAFQQISDLYSPFSLSLLPLSTGSSLPFLRNILSLSLDQYTLTSSQHCSPGDALEIHRIMKSKRSVGIHWGTFCDGDEARGTRVEFGRERRRKGINGSWNDHVENEAPGRFVVSEIGETLVIPE